MASSLTGVKMSVYLYARTDAKDTGCGQFIFNFLSIKHKSIKYVISDIDIITESAHKTKKCTNLSKAMILASCLSGSLRNTTHSIFVQVFANNTSAFFGCLRALSLSIESQICVFTESVAYIDQKFRNTIFRKIVQIGDTFGFGSFSKTAWLDCAPPRCRCHNTEVDVFWMCSKCRAVYCRLVSNCSSCKTRFILSK